MLPRPLQESNVVGKGGTAGFLGREYDPYTLYPEGDDMDMDKMSRIRVDDLQLRADVFAARLERRARLRGSIDLSMPEIDKAVAEYRLDEYYDRALNLVISGRAREAFSLDQEPRDVRDRYGRNTFGQSLMLARRLVEAGTRVVEVILAESRAVLRQVPGVLIVEHRLGFVMANAGVDASNIEQGGQAVRRLLLLPEDPDASAARLAAALGERTGVAPGVVINDSLGRAWRNGTVGTALGCAGLPALLDRRGERDLFGRALQVTEVALADQVAAAAALLQGEAAEGRPVVLVRGLGWPEAAPVSPASALLRPRERDLFR